MYTFTSNDPIDYIDVWGLLENKKTICQRGYITPLTPEQPDWYVEGLWQDDTALPTIVCNGAGQPRIQYPKGRDPTKVDPCVAACLVKHEECHIEDALASNPKICSGQPDGAQIKTKDRARYASEVKCSQVQLNCLNARKADSHCSAAAIDAAIKAVEEYRDRYKGLLDKLLKRVQ